jgi:lipopolysaccharide exporter
MLRRSVLVRRASILFVGELGAKAAGIVALVFIARLYTTEAFGFLGLLQALVVTILVIASLGYQAAIALPEDEANAASVLWLSMAWLGIFSILTAAAAMTWREPISRLLAAPALAHLIWWAPGLLVALGMYDVLSYWLTRARAFKQLAGIRLIMTVTIAASQVGAWLLGATQGGLIVGLVLGTGAAAAGLAAHTWKTYRSQLMSGLSWPRIRQVAQVYWQFPAYQAPASVLNAASSALIPLGLGYFFAPSVVGAYWLADRVCGYLTNLVRQSMLQVFLHRAAEVANQGGNIRSLFHRTTLGLMLLAIVPTVAFVGGGPFLFGLAFGAEWSEAGTYARWLAVAWFFSMANIPAGQLVAIFHLQRWLLTYGIGLAAFRVGAVVAGGLTEDPLMVIAVYAIGNAVCTLGLNAGMTRYLRQHSPAPVHGSYIQI